jgi:EmrB/QacA subfamily drug resistance transporter
MRKKPVWVLIVASVASLMVALDALVVTTALPTIRVHLGASIEELEWTVNAYTLSFAVLLLTGAALGDRFGRRRMFSAGLAIFSGASAACALAPDVGSLIAARAVQGAGAALIMPLGMTLLSTAYAPEQRARALGIFSGITGLAVLAGPVIGGAITQGIAWQWIFWINVPIGLLTIPVVLRRVDESYGPRSAPDVAGLALVTGAALGLVWALVRGNSAGWGSVEVIAALVVGVALAVAFVLWERRAAHPMLPMEMFASRPFSSSNAAIFFLAAALYGAVFFMAQFLQTVQHHGPLDAGVRLLPWTATLFIVAPITGARISRVGERPFAVVGLLPRRPGWAGSR